MNTYNLDVLYKGYDDPSFKSDFDKVTQMVDEFNQLANELTQANKKENVVRIVKANEQLTQLVKDLGTFLSLKQSINTSDGQATNFESQLYTQLAKITKASTTCEQYIIACSDLATFIENDAYLKQYEYYLTQIQKSGKYLLSEEVEETIAKLNMDAGNAWEKQFEYLTSSLEIEKDGKTYTLSEIRNMAYDPDSTVRKGAYEAELQGYRKIKDAIAFSLNSIKGQTNTICEMRGYESALHRTLENADMKQETLDAMLSAMKDYMPKFRQYLKRKATLLGHNDGLPFYDLFAVVASDDRKYTIEEAKAYLVNSFSSFSSDLSQMVNTAFEQDWIDFFPRKGKVGGAFCANLVKQKQSRILTNYDGYFGDIVTLAHELGHAYHGEKLIGHAPLNLSYSMPVAETASTFNENLIMNKAIHEATGEAKIALIENQLQDATQIIVDIYSRFLFEKEVLERRKDEFLFAEQLEEIMINAQKEAYGDGLDSNYLHPYMWVCKSHYYSAGLSFYNFPYAFGGLFAKGLYAMYLEDKDAFVPKYKQMLYNTTIMSVEDCAKTMGIDLTQKAFWEKSLAMIASNIDEFLEATN